MSFQKLPLETQTLYAELLEQLTALETRRTLGHLSGCFTAKAIKGESYSYFQYSDPGGVQRQVYLGKKTPVLERVIELFQAGREVLKGDVAGVQRLCAQLRVGGALVMDAASARVLRAFAESGIFHLGGVLVGAHAFAVLGNILGVRWKEASLRTQDLDLAGETGMDLAVSNIQADLPGILESLEMGFLPVPPLNPKNPSTSFKVRGKSLRVDLLTPGAMKGDERPVWIPRFKAAAQPLRFLDYLIERSEKGAVIDGGGILVNVPTPARFAFHKLIVSRERGASMHVKTEKDLFQAAQVFAVLAEERPGDLLLAWEELRRRGEGWTRRTVSGLSAMRKGHSAVYEKVREVIPDL